MHPYKNKELTPDSSRTSLFSPVFVCLPNGRVVFKNAAAKHLLPKPRIGASLLPLLPPDKRHLFFPESGSARKAHCGILSLPGLLGPVHFLTGQTENPENRYTVLMGLPYLRGTPGIFRKNDRKLLASELSALALAKYEDQLPLTPSKRPDSTLRHQRHLWDLSAKCIALTFCEKEEEPLRSAGRLLELLSLFRDRLCEPYGCGLEIRNELPDSQGVFLKESSTFLAALLFFLSFGLELADRTPGSRLPCLSVYLQERRLHLDLSIPLSRDAADRLPQEVLTAAELQNIFPEGALTFTALSAIQSRYGLRFSLQKLPAQTPDGRHEEFCLLRTRSGLTLDKRFALSATPKSLQSDFLEFLAYLCI